MIRRPPFVLLQCSMVLLVTVDARAYCPCYTLSSPNNTHKCGVEAIPGKNPTTAQWIPIFDLVAQGPSQWGNAGPSVSNIGQGCGKPEPMKSVAARFPCELLKAIAMAESGWRQFCRPDTPPDQKPDPERTIISFDCGYGASQVTSGMHIGENPAYDRKRVAGEPTYNLATGAKILAGKWAATECVGDNQPRILEHWYSAAWAYNGLAYSNNPNNPNLDPKRGVYDPAKGGAYAYQEKVFGRVEHPPSTAHWKAVKLAYPNRAQIGNGSKPPALPEPTCASPTDCVNKRATHVSSCFATNPTPPDLAMAPRDLAAPAPRDLAAAPSDADAVVTVDATTPAAPDAGEPPSPSGCGCRVGRGREARTSGLLAPLLGLLLVVGRASVLVARRRRSLS